MKKTLDWTETPSGSLAAKDRAGREWLIVRSRQDNLVRVVAVLGDEMLYLKNSGSLAPGRFNIKVFATFAEGATAAEELRL